MRPSLVAIALLATLLSGCLSTTAKGTKSDDPNSSNPRPDLMPSSVGPNR